jgi:hypothetical protein
MAELAAALRKSVAGFRLPAGAASAAAPAAARAAPASPPAASDASQSRLKKLLGT